MPDRPALNPVIRFEPDGYDVSRPWLMGRQVAGNGFLRAAVLQRGPGALFCYTPSKASSDAFAAMVHGVDPTAEAGWVRASQVDLIGRIGRVLYVPDATVATAARVRLGAGLGAYSICGVTHTTATPGTLREIADLVSAPVAPWDALVCTSQAVVETVRRVHEAEAEALQWRLGCEIEVRLPELPVIPLGVHTGDFDFSDADRAAARAALGIAQDEVVALFVGRLTFSGKHHPFAMYRGLLAAAERTGRKVVLVQCGWAPNATIKAAFETGPALFAPGVRALSVDGRVEAAKRQAWAAGDLFISLSDGIQETFGLTPIEAMAAGLPCVVSDWNGYKDTVRDGVDGFRVPTWAPSPGAAGAAIAREHQVGEYDYDRYLWMAASATSVDAEALADRLARLVSDDALRRALGAAGRARARADFEWAAVYRQYQDLWSELDARREAALRSPQEAARIASAPRAASTYLDPFHAFGHYPTTRIQASTRVSLAAGASLEAYEARRSHVLFSGLRLPDPMARAVLEHLQAGDADLAEVAKAVGVGVEPMIYLMGLMAKLELVRLG